MPTARRKGYGLSIETSADRTAGEVGFFYYPGDALPFEIEDGDVRSSFSTFPDFRRACVDRYGEAGSAAARAIRARLWHGS